MASDGLHFAIHPNIAVILVEFMSADNMKIMNMYTSLLE